jgi:Mrp family chromosome partitioning ATPase
MWTGKHLHKPTYLHDDMSKKLAVIGVIGQKGGGGKTTIAINLAVAAARQKLAAVIIDLDQQTNSTKWRARRRSDNVAVVAAPASRIKATIETAVTHGAQFIVIDSLGHNDNSDRSRASDREQPRDRDCTASGIK